MKLFAILTCVTASIAQGQTFSLLPTPPSTPQRAAPGPRPLRPSVFRIDTPALSKVLAAAPDHRLDAPLDRYGLIVAIPAPDGQLIDCHVARSPVMEAPLQARYPQIQTFIVQSVDKLSSGRLELTPRGLTAMLRSPAEAGGVWMIDIWQPGDPHHAVAYRLHDLPNGGDWTCHTHDHEHDQNHVDPELPISVGPVSPVPPEHTPTPRGEENQIRRTFRIAIACTGEYGLHQCTILGHEPNTADPLAAIVTIVARTNVVYEADLGVHFNLVANNDQIIFTNPETDPYPATCDGSGGGDCSSPYLAMNSTVLAERIGQNNFDVGHVLTRVYGGVANLGVVCQNLKARGVSGIPRGGDIDPLTALVVIHELGHQFSVQHTFSGIRGRCQNNAVLPFAWEAGGGSSPMAYPGACPVDFSDPSDNVARFADPFFHLGSVEGMNTFLMSALCRQQETTSNRIPQIISLSPDRSIPPRTPFVLAAEAVDADGDTLTYSWEQFDSGVARALVGSGSGDTGRGALFRIFPPVLTSERTFPQMSDVLAGVPTPGERLPTAAGVERRFRVIVRDNSPGAGGVAISNAVSLWIAPGSSEFGVLEPVQNAMLTPGPATVRWTVGNTHAAPISCSTVTIQLSTNAGESFDHVLGTFPNNGEAEVELTMPASNARIRINADDNVFFAVSRPFSITAPCAADFNADGILNSQDFFDYLAEFFKASPKADFNTDGILNSQDYFDFLNQFFAGCGT